MCTKKWCSQAPKAPKRQETNMIAGICDVNEITVKIPENGFGVVRCDKPVTQGLRVVDTYDLAQVALGRATTLNELAVYNRISCGCYLAISKTGDIIEPD